VDNKVERLRKIIFALLAAGLTQKAAAEQTQKLKQLLLEIQTNKDKQHGNKTET
jgi:hypothetical protein